MVKKSLQWKIVLFICIIAICLVIPIGILLNINIENYHYNQFINGIEKGFSNYDPAENEGADAYDIYIDMSGVMAGLFDIYGENKSYTIVDISDNTIYSSDFNFLNSEEYRFLGELYLSSNFIKAAAGEMGDDDKLVTMNGKTFYDYAVRKAGLVFYFRYYKQDWQNMVSQFNNVIFTALILSLLIAFIFGFLISKAITIPIEHITEKTRDIAEGNFGQKLDRQGSDEIGQLTNSINDMSQSLKNMLEEIKNEKGKVDTILNNMTDGIIAFDKKGAMIHVNPAAMTMLNRRRLDENLDDFIKEYRMDTTQEEIMNYTQEANLKKLTLQRGGLVMRIGFAVFTDDELKNEGCIIILRDITEQEKMDVMQKEFVANVSHELKTPLTSIKSYTETLLSGKVEDKGTEKEFLEVIESEVDRMAELVKDLLQLSALDMKRTRIEFHKHSIPDLINKTLEKVRMAASEKNHTIEKNIQYPGKATFDFEKIQRVLINLLTNAIKYTDPGGLITIDVKKENSDIVIIVTDNGIGIPEKELPRIFDRFYRVDKARSRKMGGTGLGLAIAREIISAHNGEISIKSEPGKGTEVVMSIPLNSQWRGGNE
ncbi:MAG: HAMP domain-containing protein [Clostridia bacterium]|nr:HAMP domain-containing protein [Clostridia bacterium]